MTSDFEIVSATVPLRTVAEIKAWFGVTDTSTDTQLTMAADAVSQLVRNHVGRYLNEADFKETWIEEADDFAVTMATHLREYPLTSVTVGATIYNKSTGLVLRDNLVVEYQAGYASLPADLTLMFYDLVRQQMLAFGYADFGVPGAVPSQAPRSVSIGNLKVDFGTGANSANSSVALAVGAGALTSEALTPYTDMLGAYCSNLKFSTT